MRERVRMSAVPFVFLLLLLLVAATGGKSNCDPDPVEPICTPETEVCDGVDNDCDGAVDEDVYDTCTTICGRGYQTCVDGEWSECDAPTPMREVCDGEDNDCDGSFDEALTRACDTACGPGTEQCVAGAWTGCTAVQPEPELCDGQDNDCDGVADEGLDQPCEGACGAGTVSCEGGEWTTCQCPLVEGVDLLIIDISPIGLEGPCPPARFDVTVYNGGTESATVDKPKLVGGPNAYISDSTYGYPEYITIGAGETYTVVARAKGFTPPLQPGTVAEIMVDPSDEVPEVDEDNNLWSEELPAPNAVGDALPDFVVTKAELNPNPAEISDRIFVSVEFTNVGPGTGYVCNGTSYWSTMRPTGGGVGGAVGGTIVVPPGDTMSGGVYILEPGDLEPGDWSFLTTFDPDNEVPEADETNNTATTILTVLAPAGPPDLVITDVEALGMEGPCPPGSFSVTVTNQGLGTASIDKPKLVGGPNGYMPDYTTGYPEFVDIEPGASLTVTVRAKGLPSPLDQDFDAVLVVDPSDLLAETDETNNEWIEPLPAGSVPPGPLPDFVVTELTLSPNPAAAADRIFVSFEATNVGEGTAYVCKGTSYYTVWKPAGSGVGGSSGGTIIVPPGDTMSGGVYMFDPYELAVGTYDILGEFDRNDEILEADETNNTLTVPLVIQ